MPQSARERREQERRTRTVELVCVCLVVVAVVALIAWVILHHGGGVLNQADILPGGSWS